MTLHKYIIDDDLNTYLNENIDMVLTDAKENIIDNDKYNDAWQTVFEYLSNVKYMLENCEEIGEK